MSIQTLGLISTEREASLLYIALIKTPTVKPKKIPNIVVSNLL